MPDPTTPDGPAGEAALAALQPFVRRLLPGMLRRFPACAGLPDASRRELLPDLVQELRLDCVQRAGQLAAMTARERHGHWFRLAARFLYRQRRLGALVREHLEPAAPHCDPAGEPGPEELRQLFADFDDEQLLRLGAAAQRCGNGRYNLTATAARLGVRRPWLRRLWERAADRLYGAEFLEFWRHRLAEALTGLAADLLRDQGSLWLLPAHRTTIDPRGRLRRIRRIRSLLRIRPIPADLRLALAGFARRKHPAGIAPLPLLMIAARLHPTWSAVPMWAFEAAICSGDLRVAAQQLRTARALAADPVSIVLARARLLEARARPAAAAALLARAHARADGREGRLARALAICAAAPAPS